MRRRVVRSIPKSLGVQIDLTVSCIAVTWNAPRHSRMNHEIISNISSSGSLFGMNKILLPI